MSGMGAFGGTLFVSLFGLIYFVSFVSWSVQVCGLYSASGLLPLSSFLESRGASGWLPGSAAEIVHEFLRLPSVVQWHHSLAMEPETLLQVVCLCGAVISLAMTMNLWSNYLAASLLWILHSSVIAVGQDFSHFQWDALLMEAGFVLVFFAPPPTLWRSPRKVEPPPPTAQWLMQWLLFRLMFSSGVVKILTNDSTWWNLTALQYHYYTQCIPTPIAWYAHQLPEKFHQLSVAFMFVVEIIAPFFVFFPTRLLRHLNAALQILLQAGIILTGNYTFFNWLTVLLCLTLVDDALLLTLFPQKIINFFTPGIQVRKHSPTSWLSWWVNLLVILAANVLILDVSTTSYLVSWNMQGLKIFMKVALPLSLFFGAIHTMWNIYLDIWNLFSVASSTVHKILIGLPHKALLLTVGLFLFTSSTVPFVSRLDRRAVGQLPPISITLYNYGNPLMTTSAYGLFASMTTRRDEIIIQGSNDSEHWDTYEFKYKPGDLFRAPPFVAPLQPRLDWQMWFASLGTYQQNRWYIMLLYRLLEGSEPVIGLLEHNPFPNAPPKAIRSQFYSYKFTNFTSGSNGAWWQRKQLPDYMPEVTQKMLADVVLKHFGKEPTTPGYLEPFGSTQIWWFHLCSILLVSTFAISSHWPGTKRKKVLMESKKNE